MKPFNIVQVLFIVYYSDKLYNYKQAVLLCLTVWGLYNAFKSIEQKLL